MTESATRILFVCSRRGGRALIAAAYARSLGGARVEVVATCAEVGDVSPLARSVMEERGHPIPSRCVKTVFQHHAAGDCFDYVVSLCQQSRWNQCPVFMTDVDEMYAKHSQRLAWSVQDFAGIEGPAEERRLVAENICDQIESDVRRFLDRLRWQSAR